MDLLPFVLFASFYVLAFVGVVVPALPGVPLAAVGIVLAGWLEGFVSIDVWLIGWVVALAVFAQVADYLGSALGARVYGSSRAGLWGGIIGSVVGLIVLPPFGFLPGALVGAFAAELLSRRSPAEAWRSGVGAFVGTLGGIAVKVIVMVAIGLLAFPRFW